MAWKAVALPQQTEVDDRFSYTTKLRRFLAKVTPGVVEAAQAQPGSDKCITVREVMAKLPVSEWSRFYYNSGLVRLVRG